MAENGHAKPVLVTTDWLAEHLGEDGIVVAEVDENPDLYEEGHIPGAVKVHWRDDLQDPVERDIVDKGTFSACSASAGSGMTRRSSSTATRTTGSPPTRTGTSRSTVTATSGSSTAGARNGSTRAARSRPSSRRRRRRPTTRRSVTNRSAPTVTK